MVLEHNSMNCPSKKTQANITEEIIFKITATRCRFGAYQSIYLFIITSNFCWFSFSNSFILFLDSYTFSYLCYRYFRSFSLIRWCLSNFSAWQRQGTRLNDEVMQSWEDVGDATRDKVTSIPFSRVKSRKEMKLIDLGVMPGRRRANKLPLRFLRNYIDPEFNKIDC